MSIFEKNINDGKSYKTEDDEIIALSKEKFDTKIDKATQKEELPEEEILEMNGDIYFLIDHSSNRQIEEIEAKKLFKDKVYYTVGNDDSGQIYIFDLEKNSLLPEVRYLDGYSGAGKGGGFSFFGPGFFFIALLVGIFVYFQFFTDEKPTPDFLKGPDIIANIPTSSNPIPVVQPKEVVTITNNSNNELKALEEINSNNNNSIRFLNTELEILNLEYKALDTKFKLVTSDLNDSTIKIQTEIENLKVCKQELEKQKILNISENQLFLSIGQEMFELCENQNSEVCTNFLYKFYNLRQ